MTCQGQAFGVKSMEAIDVKVTKHKKDNPKTEKYSAKIT